MLNSKVLKFYFLIRRFFVLILFSTGVYGCQVNPASGEKEFSIMSKEEEKIMGKSEHQKIIKQFGGIYENNELQNYVESLGHFLASTSELSDLKFTFTILNTHIVNAFALPGGYIYITRGLLALCKNEAQLAGVLAHEIGHVTARHSARRYTRVFSTGIIANILNVLSKNNYALGNLVGQSANLYLLSYSRDQEFEADKLALRYMSKAGFKVEEMGTFLNSMENYGKLYSEMNFIKNSNEKSDLLSTHPLSSRRVKNVINESRRYNIASPITGKKLYYKKIDGITFGEKPSEGTIFKNHFIHPDLKISFEFDQEFYFINKPNYIIGHGPNKSKIVLDVDSNNNSNDILIYTKKILGKNFPSTYDRSTINGLEYIDISFKKSKKNNRLAIVKDGKKFFRLFLIEELKNQSQISANAFQKILRTFKKVNPENKNTKSRKVLKIIKVKKGETKQKLSDLQLIQPKFSKRVFETLNGLQDKELKEGEELKFITADHH